MNVLLDVGQRPLVARGLVVLVAVLLHRIVGQVHEGVQVAVLGRVGLGGETQVGLLEYVELQGLGQQHPHPDIELLALDEHRLLYVFLDDEAEAPGLLELLGGVLD